MVQGFGTAVYRYAKLLQFTCNNSRYDYEYIFFILSDAVAVHVTAGNSSDNLPSDPRRRCSRVLSWKTWKALEGRQGEGRVN